MMIILIFGNYSSKNNFIVISLYLHQLPVGSFGQIVGHQQVGGQEVKHLQTSEDHGKAVDEHDGLQGNKAQSSHQREQVCRKQPDLLCLHDAGTQGTHHQLT